MTKITGKLVIPWRLCYCGIGIIFLIFSSGCIKQVKNKQNLSYIQGVITDSAGKPAENAQVYVYQWLYDEGSIEKIIKEEIDSENKDYGAYRGPADFKSAKTGPDGKYEVGVSAGIYCLVARKRHDQNITEGPLDPEDASSLVSEPVTARAKEKVRISLKLLDTLRDASFFNHYLIRTYRTGFSGRVVNKAGEPVSGVVVTANEEASPISQKADFTSFPTDKEGNYTLYVYYGGVYYLGVKQGMLGPYLVSYRRDKSKNKSTSIPQGQIVSNVDLVLDEEVSFAD
jgi:hypothetical protein